MSALLEIADAVAATINDADDLGDTTVQAERRWLALQEVPDLKAVQVSVVPIGERETPRDRAGSQEEVTITLVVQKKVATAGNAEIDPLHDFVKALKAHLVARRTTIINSAVLRSTIEQEPIVNHETLREFGIFESVIPLTFIVR